MLMRHLLSAVTAFVISGTLVDTVNAYPTLARSGTTTVTGTYRPIDLHLNLNSGTFFYDPYDYISPTFAFTGQLTGTFSSSYGAAGTAGNWTLNLGFNSFNTNNYFRNPGDPAVQIMDPNDTDYLNEHDTNTNTITLRILGSNRPVGSLVYNGGLSATSGALPVDGSDTPAVGDMFLLYALNASPVFEVTVDDVFNPGSFDLALKQDLKHLGPYVFVSNGEGGDYRLDDGLLPGRTTTRVNEACETGSRRCGEVPEDSFGISSQRIPEPASLALVGLGLVALAWGRRQQRSRLSSA